VFAGCNRGSTSFAPSEDPVDGAGGSMTFGPLAMTKMACEPDVQGVETAVVAVLDGTVGLDRVGATLTFTNGDRTLTFATP
jgi:heat shock protein HslJ